MNSKDHYRAPLVAPLTPATPFTIHLLQKTTTSTNGWLIAVLLTQRSLNPKLHCSSRPNLILMQTVIWPLLDQVKSP